jgi:nicotinate-nucleotide adenylyltransferase
MRPAAFKSEALAPGMTVGLYGGTFDPPHAGHAHAARTALKRLNLDRVWWLATPGNPFKAHAPASLEHRLAAIDALVPEPRQVASGLEARLGSNRTIEVIRHLQSRHPQVRFVWVMGADGLAELHRWTEWREIAARVPICIVARPGAALKARLAPAARMLAHYRLRQCEARALPGRAPGWTYLTEPLHPQASRLMRA